MCTGVFQERLPPWQHDGASTILRKRTSPLIHHYRLANPESPVRLRRTACVKRPGSRIPRSVSFHVPVRLSTSTESNVKLSTISPLPPVDRTTEYRVFLVSVTAVTFTITVLQPLVLFHFLVQCKEPRCYEPSLAVRDSIKPSFAPCYDFYQYACSGADSPYYAKAHESLRFSAFYSISTTPTTSGSPPVITFGLGRGYMLYFAPSYHIVPFVKFLQQLQLANNFDVYIRRCAEVIGEHGMSYSRVIKAIQTVNRHFFRLPLSDALNTQIKLSTQYPLTEFWFALSKVLGKKFQTLRNVRTTYLVVDGEYAEFLSKDVFTSLDPMKISAYVGLYIVWFLSRLASHSLAYTTYVANYTDSLIDLWPRCFSDVRQLMPFAVERLYLKSHLEPSDIEHVEDMVQRISHSSRDFVISLHNITEDSETRMANRIAALGLLPYTFAMVDDVVELDRLYAHVPDQKDDNYLDNYLRLTRIIAQHMVNLLVDTAANTSRFFMPPFRMELPFMITVYNAVHLNPDNVVPPVGKSFSLNYAFIGHSVVQQAGQLFLHGPDIFNETGYNDRVWTSGYINALRRKYQCLRQLHVEQRWTDGSLPRRVLEAVVTAEILFNAYKGLRQMPRNAARFRHEAAKFGLTPEQLFFVGLCINWCQRSVQQRGLAERVCRFALPALRAFGDAFGCTKIWTPTSPEECGL
ncbi:hypothetical protein HPB50_026388 [Hyalomma asiaticum]|uniref:Uncharacterized protein n=1 Tax=Hyalomma asiaticum TaxID=266040 RepID=A0ACB7TPF4_HYAAI|nr:hypothetical protein HPB50_026388 [Hyalomma asiaticum]